LTSTSCVPPSIKCTWLSLKPGSTVRPARSIRRVDFPASGSISRVGPVCTMRPLQTASASTHGAAASTV
jgi:hypothetical protein